ncbi:MAG: hypothetical protein A3G71_00645 [Gammaproteobacteria bacterium RIFCSPLOWO2_12_FULL_38_14]|nr:MAG: hypothetical protein A3G71_00645 [Gammaproteobacteria bacterium RIFCSPLOWO2_12_FULL_38_14]
MNFMIKISGEHAQSFLQGQLTCDVKMLSEGQSCMGAHCNQKGRVLFNYLIFFEDGSYFLKLPSSMEEIAKKRLEKFSIFSKVDLEIILEKNEKEKMVASRQEDIRQGFVTIFPETSGLFTPHELNYPRWGLISFKKGCYTGQEVIARMEYLGKLKKHLYFSEIETQECVKRGEELKQTSDKRVVGVIADHYQIKEGRYLVLAVIEDNAVKNCEGHWIFCL